MSQEFQIAVSDNGELQFVYSDMLYATLKDLGDTKIQRASHVEPLDGENWYATLLDGSKTVLGPFTQRQSALQAEIEYLQERIGDL